jgi:alkane 1-monooxygenase
MAFAAQAADGTARYVDRKRYLWLSSLSGPFIPALSIGLYLKTGGNALCMLIPLAYIFIWIPIADVLFGEDTNNPPDESVAELAQDGYYRALLYIDIVIMYLGFFFAAWFVGTHDLPWWAFLAFTLGLGLTNTDSLIIGHELGHKQSRLDQITAQISLALVGYGHFRIEHNRGHHVQVATPEDHVSARMGESVYRFAKREIPGALRRGWSLECQRLEKIGLSRWSTSNEILMSWSLTAAVALVLTALFGPMMLVFLLIHHLYAWYGLTQANYVEHYGLLRQKLPNGRYEPPEPHHSWNTNHVYSNLILFHLQRHSDHHANALRPYQALRDFEGLPRLPSGYPGCFGLAAVPSLWFKVMHPKLMELAGGDLSKLNVDPERREELEVYYGRVAEVARDAEEAASG